MPITFCESRNSWEAVSLLNAAAARHLSVVCAQARHTARSTVLALTFSRFAALRVSDCAKELIGNGR